MTQKIKREINTIGLLFISFTAIFGSGWLFAPLYAAQIAGPAALIAWVVGGLMSSVIGLTMAEIITLLPKAGGTNTVAQLTHGKLLGFLVNILTLTVCIVLPVLEVRAILQYLASKFSWLMVGDQITFVGYAFAGILLVAINWLNIYGAKLTSRINTLSVLFKLITPLVVCFCFLSTLNQTGHFTHENLDTLFPLKWDQIFLAISTSGIIFSFNGFNQATLFAAEAKNPQKSIPFAILGSILLTAVIYILIQYVFLVSLPQNLLTNGWQALQFQGDSGPFAGLAILLGLHFILYFIYADAIISPLGTAFTYSSATPRMFYAFAENTASFTFLKKLNQKGVPSYSILFCMLLGYAAFIFLPNLKAMITILVVAFVLNYTTAPISLLTLRKTYPDNPATFKVPCVYVFCTLSLFFSNVMAYCCGFVALRNLLVLVLVSLCLGVFFFKIKSKTRLKVAGALWFVFELICLTLLSYLQKMDTVTFMQALGIIALLSIFLIITAPRKLSFAESEVAESEFASVFV